MAAPPPPASEPALDALLEKLAKLQRGIDSPATAVPPLRWVRCTAGSTTRMFDINDILFFRSDEKYTRVQTRTQEGFIRTPIRELLPQLDPNQFCQVHRSAVVNLAAVEAVTRDDDGRQRVHLRDFPEVLEVSRSFAHLFRSS
jgi:DNA-binding LytR/AlgR family response regulator